MLRVIVTVVILVLVLSFFGISLQHLVEAPATQSNFGYVGDLVTQGWNNIVALFNSIF